MWKRSLSCTSSRLIVVALTAIALSACKPDYPSCETDRDCREKEFCVDRKCQQCRQNGDCPTGQACTQGKCNAIPGYCSANASCPTGTLCINNQCRPCAADNECPTPAICHKGTCKVAKRCQSANDCEQDEDCVDGICQSAPRSPPISSAPCPLPSVFFDFNEATLTSEATRELSGALVCLKTGAGPVRATGHADPRGTQEYNLALSERRARAVREHLGRLGIDSGKVAPLPRGALDAQGTDEATWARDRRVDLAWQ